MLELALLNPKIPPNTGNLIRLTANMGAQLHLIHPLGFALDEKKLRRAGLDYHQWSAIKEHEHFDAFIEANQSRRIIACETFADELYSDFKFEADDIILMGAETVGISQQQAASCTACVKLPMREGQRSLNLSNAAAIIMYEAWRQLGFF